MSDDLSHMEWLTQQPTDVHDAAQLATFLRDVPALIAELRRRRADADYGRTHPMNDDLSDEQLDELTLLHEAATPGPWRAYYHELWFGIAGTAVRHVQISRVQDAEYVAAARNALGSLIAELRRRRAEGAEIGHWYCVVDEHAEFGNPIKAGPFKYAETAAVVRVHIEARDVNTANWNIRIRRIIDIDKWRAEARRCYKLREGR